MFKKISLILLTVVLMATCFMVTACKKDVYTVAFNSDGGTPIAQQRIEEGSKATKPTDPTKVGYSFDNWYLGQAETPFDFGKTAITRNTTLKAKWIINQYSITFDSDGGSAVDTITQDYNSTVVAPADPTMAGYIFGGWYEEGSQTPYTFNKIEARNVSLKARWTIGQFSITFDSNGGSAVDTITQEFNTSVTKPADPVRIGYTFRGWHEPTSIIQYVFNKIEPRNITLKAIWGINQYSITFDSNGGSAVDAITQDYNTTVVAPTSPIMSGYTFGGWYEEGADTPYTFNTIEARDVSLKAVWNINQYSITFDSDGGSAVDTITQDYNTSVTKPADPTRIDYNFLGWFEEGQESAYVFNTIEARNVVLKAKWGEKTKYSIVFDSDGGSIVPTIIGSEDTSVSAPANPTKEGHTFVGWFEEGQENAYVFNTIEERNVSLKAKWTINQYSISFDTDGGVPATIETITQDYGTAVAKPADPTKDGFVFLGWIDQETDQLYEIDTIEAKDVELKASWAEIRGVITLDKNLQGIQVNGLAQGVLTPYVGQEVLLPELDCWGYEFKGWKNLSTGELIEEIDGEYKIVHDGNDVTYQAQWDKISQDSDII
ncbi:MAG: InlB B-repeat-containing protein [Clostridia bacterium]|nr:InlB B-repeat-containing protein [Clostridia bacterium]